MELKANLHFTTDQQKKTTKDDELFKRIITGAAITAASVIIAVYSDHVNVMKSAVSLFGIAAVAELFRAAKATQHIPLLSVMLLTAAATPFFETGIYPYLLFFVFGAAVIISLYFMLHIDKLQRFKTGQTVLISLITLTLIRSFYEITRLPNGRLFLWLTVVVCASTDIFAYLIGRQIGTHKLARKISPNKTVEGCVSGTICALLFGFLFTVIASTELEIQVHFGLLLPMILLLSCIGQFGDLSLSAVKRICSVKDFGRILPGHGGILDRIDSMLFAVPLSYILCFLGIHLFP
nr:phosphatidate cytidylyltransferase [uncultured Ruminococcus sp.]